MQNPHSLSQRQTRRVAHCAISGLIVLVLDTEEGAILDISERCLWARTCAQSGTDMKASVPPWDSPGTVSTHRTAALGVSDDFQSDDLNDGPRRRAQSRNVPRLVCVRSAHAADADPKRTKGGEKRTIYHHHHIHGKQRGRAITLPVGLMEVEDGNITGKETEMDYDTR